MDKKKKPSKPTGKVNVRKSSQSSGVLGQDLGWVNWVLIGIIVIVTYITFAPAIKNNFTNWDDKGYVLDNKFLKEPLPVVAGYFFSHFFMLNYHPLTMVVYAMEFKSAGLTPELYHKVNIWIHLLNVMMVFWFIYFLSKKKTEVAAFVTLFFAVHPMHVESVAWVSELKDVLYMFFLMGALICYLKYIDEKEKRKLLFIVSTFVLFVVSMLCKPASVPLPLALILIDYYRKRPMDKMAWMEKIPFFLVAILFGVLTYLAQVQTAIAKFETFTIFQRIMHGTYALNMYLFKFFLPFNLSAIYPYPWITDGHLPYIFYFSPFISLVIFALVFLTLKFTRLIAFGFLFFFVNMILVLQFLSVGNSLVSERYTYLSYLGLLFVLGIYFCKLFRSENQMKHLVSVGIVIIGIFFSFQSNARCKVWFNAELLWTDVLEQFPNNSEAYILRGNYLVEKSKYDVNPGQNDYDKAFEDYTASIKFKSNDPMVYSKRGNIYGLRKQFDKSLADYSMALSLDSNNEEVYLNRAITYSMMKKYDSAFADYDKNLRKGGDPIGVYQNRAYAYLDAGKFQESINDYDKIIQNKPNDPGNYFFRAFDHYQLKNYDKSIEDNSKAIQLNPNNAQAYFNRSQSYKNLNNFKSALEDALKAKELGFTVDAGYVDMLKSQVK